MPAVAFDLHHPELVAQELGEAGRRLSRETDVPASVKGLVEEVAGEIVSLGVEPLAVVDPAFWTMLQNAALNATLALQIEDERQQRRRLRVSLEQMRFLFTRMAEGQPVSEEQEPADVARWLLDVMQISQRQLAELLGVGERTLQRWVSPTERTTPDGDDLLRLRLLARLVNQLRRTFTGPGVIGWLRHPHPDLGGQAPVDVLDAPGMAETLTRLAVASRLSIAS